MSTLRRFAREESGMTMGLAVMMILLISVMGAGLLTFVSRDLNTVLEVNRGQRAFEVADAGIGAAKRQLASNVVREDYDDDPNTPVDDIQWSAAQGGLTLDNLDGSATTQDSVNVQIQYQAETEDSPEHFLVISEGTYGDAKRRIEAIFEGVELNAGGEDIGHPLYFTPSDIKIESQVALNAISMFAGGDILIQGLTNPTSFVTEYENPQGTLSLAAADDELCNWDTDTPIQKGNGNPCFEDATGPWNTTPRTYYKKTGPNESLQNFVAPGFAAEGKICGFPANSTAGNCAATGNDVSAADGVYGYDSTTGAKTMTRTGYTHQWGNNLAFVDKTNMEPNPPNTITYPFPRLFPIPEEFKKKACLLPPSSSASLCAPVLNNDYFVGSPTPAQWGTLLDSSDPNRIAFVDAQNQNITFNPSSAGQMKGILVVWCGNLVQDKAFTGIILNLHGDGSAFGSTNCAGNGNLGTYTNGGLNGGQSCQCWLYADGGTASRSGITLRNGSKIFFLPSPDWSFLSSLFEAPPPTSFDLRNWRELYE
jgi:hypothetical protein